MKNQFKYILIMVTFAIIYQACKPNLKAPKVEKGELDVTNYVAIGDAITAGYTNGALYFEGQNNSFAILLAKQFEQIGGGDFKTPFVSASSIGVGNANNAPSKLAYRIDCQGAESLGPVKIATQGDLSVFSTNVFSTQGPFNNLGVADAKIIDVFKVGYSNPFYSRITPNNSSSILLDAVSKNPTFFTLQLGLSDVLSFALKGATSESITPIAGGVGIGFDASINDIVNKLTANGAKGVIANIPSIKTLAYFNTIAFNALNLDTAKARNLNLFYSSFNIKFKEGNNGFIIEDRSQFSLFRQAVEGELILLNVPLDSIKCNNFGSLNPIFDKYVLTLSEIEIIEKAIGNYNAILKNIANLKNLAFVDMNAFFSNIKTGFTYNGVTVNAAFVSGGAFSLDGLNLTPRGNALLANEFIKAINFTYKSTLPPIEATKYSGIIFP